MVISIVNEWRESAAVLSKWATDSMLFTSANGEFDFRKKIVVTVTV
jgi:hypothetical protein